MTTIVVGVDGSQNSQRALSWACNEAKHDRSVRITAVSAWSTTVPVASPWFVGYDLPVDLTEATAAVLKETVASVTSEQCPDVAIDEQVRCGSAGAVLIAEGENADLLVVGSRGLGGFKGLLLGSVSHQVVTHAPCPVVVVPSAPARHDAAAMHTIVVGIDGSKHSRAALNWAARRAQATGATVHAVHAWQYPPIARATIGTGVSFEDQFEHDARNVAHSFIDAAEIPDGVTIVPVPRHGPAAEMLLREAKHADLLVVGARGSEGFAGLLLGSVTNAVAHHTPCPLAVIREQ